MDPQIFSIGFRSAHHAGVCQQMIPSSSKYAWAHRLVYMFAILILLEAVSLWIVTLDKW